jgi:hypothetical protein
MTIYQIDHLSTVLHQNPAASFSDTAVFVDIDWTAFYQTKAQVTHDDVTRWVLKQQARGLLSRERGMDIQRWAVDNLTPVLVEGRVTHAVLHLLAVHASLFLYLSMRHEHSLPTTLRQIERLQLPKGTAVTGYPDGVVLTSAQCKSAALRALRLQEPRLQAVRRYVLIDDMESNVRVFAHTCQELGVDSLAYHYLGKERISRSPPEEQQVVQLLRRHGLLPSAPSQAHCCAVM